MFTVKWIASNGSQMIYQAKGDIGYSPEDVSGDRKIPVVSFTDQEGTFCSLDSGDIFVMNDHGKTVARYTLKTDAFPTGIAPKAA